MAGEIQLNSITFATESGGTVTVANVDSATNRQNLGLEIGVDVQAFDTDTTKNDVANTFTANQIISVTDNTNAALRVTQEGTGNALVVEDETNPDSTPFVVDASGKVFVGADTSITSIFGSSPSKLGISGTASPLIIETVGENAFGSRIDLLKTRGTTSNSKTIVNNADTLGEIYFGGTDGTSALPSARIFAQVDGTPGTNDMPGRLVFSTTADGASSTTERMRIDSSGITHLNNGTIASGTITIADDAVGTIAMPNQSWTGGIAIFSLRSRENFPQTSGRGIFGFDCGSSLALTSLVSSGATTTTGAMTGTTGSDGTTNFSVVNSPSRAILIENRLGLGSVEYSYLLIQ